MGLRNPSSSSAKAFTSCSTPFRGVVGMIFGSFILEVLSPADMVFCGGTAGVLKVPFGIGRLLAGSGVAAWICSLGTGLLWDEPFLLMSEPRLLLFILLQ